MSYGKYMVTLRCSVARRLARDLFLYKSTSVHESEIHPAIKPHTQTTSLLLRNQIAISTTNLTTSPHIRHLQNQIKSPIKTHGNFIFGLGIWDWAMPNLHPIVEQNPFSSVSHLWCALAIQGFQLINSLFPCILLTTPFFPSFFFIYIN